MIVFFNLGQTKLYEVDKLEANSKCKMKKEGILTKYFGPTH